jgi:hypothetical protein
MESDQHLWQVWTDRFHRWGIAEWSAEILESAGPLTILAAQIVYLSQPILSWFVPENHLHSAARILEQPDQLSEFIKMLRQETGSA